MKRFQPSRIAVAALVVLAVFTCVERVEPTDMPGGSQVQEEPRVSRVPFREVNHRILMNVEVDGAPTTLLFDTGARVSVLLKQKGHDCKLRLAHRMQSKFALACTEGAPSVGFLLPEKEVRFDGFVGADLMSKFALVRIDYSHHLIELEN